MKKNWVALLGLVLFWLCGWISFAVAEEVPTITPIMENGPSENRINIVFLSEAYVASQQETFFNDVNIVVENVFTFEPFKAYKNYFNVYAIWVASKDSLLSAKGTDTYFGALGGLGSDGDKVRSVVGSFFLSKNSVLTIMLINDDRATGLGGNFGLSSGIIGAVGVGTGRLHHEQIFVDFIRNGYLDGVVHELGHALGALEDEYPGINPAMKPGQTEVDFGGPFPNVTTETSRGRIRWKYWIDPTTPMPTPPDSDEYANVVGLFEGANAFALGWYRPALKCAMGKHTLEERMPPFCPVCREVLILAIHRYINPAGLPKADVGEKSTVFSVDTPQLITDADDTVETTWTMDGNVLLGQNSSRLEVTDKEIGYGRHTIAIHVVTKTNSVRYDPAKLLERSYEWLVVSFPEPDFNGDGKVDFFDFFLFADHFGSADPIYDLDASGKVDFPDFFLFADSFGQSASSLSFRGIELTK